MKKNKNEQTEETDFDKFYSNLNDLIMNIREEMKWQYHRFVELESRIHKLNQDFIDLKIKYDMLKRKK